MAPARFCRHCGHIAPDGVKHQRRVDGACGDAGTGRLDRSRTPCRCYCEYGDERVVLRIRGECRWVSNGRKYATTTKRDEAETMTLDGARWYARLFPVALDPERA